MIKQLITYAMTGTGVLNLRGPHKKQKLLHAAVAALGLAACSSASADPIATSMFGAQDHMGNTDTFSAGKGYGTGYDPNNSIPRQKKLNGRWVRDGVTASIIPVWASVNLPSDSAASKQNVAKHRALINSYLSLYDKSGMQMIFTIMALPPEFGPTYAAYNADFVTYISQLVHDHPSIYAIELHNEPNIGKSWAGTPEEYTAVYKPFADAVHQARPAVKVLGCGGCNYYYSNTWVNRAFAAGLMDFIDGISLHPYNGPVAPEVDSLYENHGTWEDSQVHLWGVYQAFNTTKKPFELDFTEMGYASVPGGGGGTPDEATQAAYLSRLMIESQDLRAKGVPLNAAIWYDFKNDHDPALDSTPNPEHNFGLYNFDLSSYKPAFNAYRNIINAFPDSSDIITAPAGVSASANMNASAVSTRLWQRKSDGAIIVPYWRLDQVKSVTADFSAYLTVTVPDSSKITSVAVKQACGLPAYPKFTPNGTSVTFRVLYKRCASWATIK